MALQLKDRVRTACTTVGTGNIIVGSNRAGYQNWDAITNGNTVYYCIVEGNAWEVGHGVKTDGNITRNLIASSTGSLIDLKGTEDVFETYPAEKAVILNTDGNIELPSSNIKANKFVGDGSELTNIPTSADTYTKTEIDDQQLAQDAEITANTTDIETNTADISTNTGNISSNTTAIGTLSGQVSQNSEDIAELQDSIFFSSAYSADYPSSPNRDPEEGNMYLQNFAMFTYSYAEATQIFASKTDESGNVRQFTAIQAGDSIVLNEVDSPNYGRYELVTVEDVSDSYVVMNVIPKKGQGTVITGVKVAFQAFPKPDSGGGEGTVADGCIYLNNQTITADYTIPAGKNGMSAGAIKFDGTVTVPTGSAYHVVDSDEDSLWTDVGGVATYGGDIKVNGVTVGKGNTSRANNTAVGSSSLANNTTGDNNVAVGVLSLRDNETGSSNTAVGRYAGLSNVDGYENTYLGNNAGNKNVSGQYNTAVGVGALLDNNGTFNTALGKGALNKNASGEGNTAIGTDALY